MSKILSTVSVILALTLVATAGAATPRVAAGPRATLAPAAANLRQLTAGMTPLQIPNAGGMPDVPGFGAGLPAPEADAGSPDTGGAPSDPAAYAAGVTLGPGRVYDARTTSTSYYYGMYLDPSLWSKIRASMPSAVAYCQAGRFNPTATAMTYGARYYFRRLPGTAGTYLFTFTSNIPPAYLRLYVGATPVNPAAINSVGTTRRVLLNLNPAASGNTVAISLIVRGQLSAFTLGAAELQSLN